MNGLDIFLIAINAPAAVTFVIYQIKLICRHAGYEDQY